MPRVRDGEAGNSLIDVAAILAAIDKSCADDQIPWVDLWMVKAHAMSKRSRCVRDRVGAVLVSHDEVLLAAGYNGPAPTYPGVGPCTNWCERAKRAPVGTPAGASYDDCPTNHAEINCLVRAPAYSGKAVLYVSTVPCVSCAKYITACASTKGLVEVVAMAGGVGDVYRDTTRAVDVLTSAGVSFRTWSPTGYASGI